MNQDFVRKMAAKDKAKIELAWPVSGFQEGEQILIVDGKLKGRTGTIESDHLAEMAKYQRPEDSAEYLARYKEWYGKFTIALDEPIKKTVTIRRVTIPMKSISHCTAKDSDLSEKGEARA